MRCCFENSNNREMKDESAWYGQGQPAGRQFRRTLGLSSPNSVPLREGTRGGRFRSAGCTLIKKREFSQRCWERACHFPDSLLVGIITNEVVCYTWAGQHHFSIPELNFKTQSCLSASWGRGSCPQDRRKAERTDRSEVQAHSSQQILLSDPRLLSLGT